MTTTLDVPTLSSRSYRFTQTVNDDGLTLEGYAAVFDQPARVSNILEGNFTEIIKRGAFAKAVRQNPKPIMQFDHGLDTLIGALPIGVITSMREDDKGLFVSARIHDNWHTIPVRDAIKSGAIQGMSVQMGIAPEGQTWDVMRENREVNEISYLPEMGPVVHAAYNGTEVTMRSRQLYDALQDEETRRDLAFALILEKDPDEDPDEDHEESREGDEPDTETRDDDSPTDADSDPAPEAAGEEKGSVPDTEIADPEQVSAPNPATRKATLIAVEAALVAQRSNYEPDGLSDG